MDEEIPEWEKDFWTGDKKAFGENSNELFQQLISLRKKQAELFAEYQSINSTSAEKDANESLHEATENAQEQSMEAFEKAALHFKERESHIASFMGKMEELANDIGNLKKLGRSSNFADKAQVPTSTAENIDRGLATDGGNEFSESEKKAPEIIIQVDLPSTNK